jgi:hypothetical protein
MMRARKTGSHARSRSFRQAFLAGFANRIGQRLEQSSRSVISDVLKEQGSAESHRLTRPRGNPELALRLLVTRPATTRAATVVEK